MAEETTTTTEPAKGKEAEKSTETTTEEAVTSQAENPDAVKRALDAERKTAKEAAKRAEAAEAKVREFEEKDKSELERATGKVDSLTGENKNLASENLKLRVAAAKQLPADLIDRLQGSTQEELEADADKLLDLVGTSRTSTSFDNGARETAAGGASAMDAAIRRQAGF